jgi:hypothetical protein
VCLSVPLTTGFNGFRVVCRTIVHHTVDQSRLASRRRSYLFGNKTELEQCSSIGQSLFVTHDAQCMGKKWSYVALHSHFYILIATRDARHFTRNRRIALKMERKSEVGGGDGTSLQKGVKSHKFRHLPPSQHITYCCCQQPSCQPHTQ